MLVGLRLKSFPNERTDRQVTAEVQATRQISADSGEWRKFKLPPATLEPVLVIHRRIRTWTYNMTLKWEAGRQLLPASKFVEYTEEFALWKEQSEQAVNAFLMAYPAYVAARKQALNGDFDPSDYPEDPSRFFACEFLLYPLPDESHITAKFGKNVAEAMKTSLAKANEDRVEEAMADLWTRILKPVQHVVEKLSEENPLFRDSLIANVQEMLDEAPDFNFLKSPEVTTALRSIQEQIANANANTLRDDQAEKAAVLKSAKKIVATFGKVAGRKLNLS